MQLPVGLPLHGQLLMEMKFAALRNATVSHILQTVAPCVAMSRIPWRTSHPGGLRVWLLSANKRHCRDGSKADLQFLLLE
jgi:hypothetical protein